MVTAQTGVLRPASRRGDYLPAQTIARDLQAGVSILPMGSLYEAVQLVFFDLISIMLRSKTGQSAEQMRGRHTNLE